MKSDFISLRFADDLSKLLVKFKMISFLHVDFPKFSENSEIHRKILIMSKNIVVFKHKPRLSSQTINWIAIEDIDK